VAARFDSLDEAAPIWHIADWILGSMSSGVVAIDHHGDIALLNRGAERILRCALPQAEERGAAPDRSCESVLARQPEVARLLRDTLAGRGPVSRAELALEGVDGRPESTIGLTLTPIRDPSGELRGAAMIFRDLTRFERLDEQERLHERLAALGQMAAGLAHEIRNPLAGMEVVAGLLRRRLKGREEDLALVAQLVNEIRSVAQTVTDCLEFVRPVEGAHQMLDPAELMGEALSLAASRLEFAGTVEREFPDALEKGCADPESLRMVLADLIVNALEAMNADGAGESGRLRLALQIHEPRAETTGVRELWITVQDSGPGIPEDLREKVFYPFFTTKQSGSGVGLANAQKVVASHGGSIEVDEATPGCAIRLRLPFPSEGSPSEGSPSGRSPSDGSPSEGSPDGRSAEKA
jgi:nitrogen-specific signal transduction histidine kinase